MSVELSSTPSDIRLRKYCLVVPTLDEGCRLCSILQLIPNSERSIMRVNTRLKNNQTLRAVVKRSVNKHNKLGVQSVVEMYEAVSLFVA